MWERGAEKGGGGEGSLLAHRLEGVGGEENISGGNRRGHNKRTAHSESFRKHRNEGLACWGETAQAPLHHTFPPM